MTSFEKNSDDIVFMLEGTDLITKILDISRDGSMYKFGSSDRHMSKGYNAFIRKMANKIVEIQKKNEEVNMVLESIPEWRKYVEGDLSTINTIESKPLAMDPRKKESPVEDDIEYFFKIKAS